MLELPRRFRPVLWVSVPALAVALFISACNGSLAQTEYNDVPILVAAEDEDPTYVKRTSDIFKRTILELKIPLRRYGFAVVSEESVAVDLVSRSRNSYNCAGSTIRGHCDAAIGGDQAEWGRA